MSLDPYESEQLLREYLLFHYGSAEEVLPHAFGPRDALDFPRRCVSECLDPETLPSRARALDLGCAVGRSSFELARFCGEVIGLDASESFIGTANRLQRDGALDYKYKLVGEIYKPARAVVPAEIDRSRVRFQLGDAQRLSDSLGRFDVVLAANLLCRLPEPARLLNRLPALLKPGGRLILCSPYTWLESFTLPENWLGGAPEKGEPLQAIEQALFPAFEKLAVKDMPFLIREHARKYQWSVAQASTWRRL